MDCNRKTLQFVPQKQYMHRNDNISRPFAQIRVSVFYLAEAMLLFVLPFDVDLAYEVDFGYALADDWLVQLENCFNHPGIGSN